MRYLILSAAHQYHTGDWQEDLPMWSPKLDEAHVFLTKEIALDTMRRHLQEDASAERPPSFAGARVIELETEMQRLAMRELRARGYHARFNDSCTMIWIEFDEKKIAIDKAIATFPREFYGLPVRLMASSVPVAWNRKAKP